MRHHIRLVESIMSEEMDHNTPGRYPRGRSGDLLVGYTLQELPRRWAMLPVTRSLRKAEHQFQLMSGTRRC